MSFSFIDRIIAIDTDHARGMSRRPPAAPPLPPWLVIEAVGQLAAWIAMARCDFTSRPVAALVGDVCLCASAGGRDIDLEAHIERLDGRAILYSGRASTGGNDIVVLKRCVGPLLPMDAFDDPGVVRARLAALRADAPAADEAPGELPHIDLAEIELRPGTAYTRLHVPASAAFFADHFPRRPVLPASLLAEALNRLATPLAAQALAVAPERVRAARLSDFKVRSFSPPGQVLDLAADAGAASAEQAVVRVAATVEGRRVASGRFEFQLAPPGVA